MVVGFGAQLVALLALAWRGGDRLARIDEKLTHASTRIDRLEADVREARDTARAVDVRLALVAPEDP